MSVFTGDNNGFENPPSQEDFSSKVHPFIPLGGNPGAMVRNTPVSATRSNIMGSNGSGNSMSNIITNEYSQYGSIMSKLRQYEFHPMTEKVIELVRDYILRTIDYESPIVTISPDKLDPSIANRFNEILESLDFRNLLIADLDKIVYYGSKSYAIVVKNLTNEDGSPYKEYKLSKLKSPYDVVMVKNDSNKFYVVNRSSGVDGVGGGQVAGSLSGASPLGMSNSACDLIGDDKILYLGAADLELNHDQASLKLLETHFKNTSADISSNQGVASFGVEAYKHQLIMDKLKEDNSLTGTSVNDPSKSNTIVLPSAFNLADPYHKAIYRQIIDHPYNISAAKPLYYSVHMMLKDYIIKDLMMQVLGVKSSIQPLILTWGVDSSYNYSQEELTELVNTVESRFNKIVDVDLFSSATYDVSTLVNRILGNIRVIPDLGHNIRALDSKELDDITRKIDDINNKRQLLKDEILDAVGIPKDLFEGATNREEVLKRDERFQSMVLKFINRLKTAVKSTVLTFAKLEGIVIEPSWIEVTMFKKSSLEYSINTARLESVRELGGTLMQVTSDLQQLMQMESVNKDAALAFFKKQLALVGADISELFIDGFPTAPDHDDPNNQGNQMGGYQ